MSRSRPYKRLPGEPKRGPLPWNPSPVERRLVEIGVASGMTHKQIADALDVTRDTLEKRCRKELDAGVGAANIKVGGALFQKCMKGDTTAIIWWEKTRCGMKDLSRVEHTGADGRPIEYRQLSDEQLNAEIDELLTRYRSAEAVRH